MSMIPTNESDCREACLRIDELSGYKRQIADAENGAWKKQIATEAAVTISTVVVVGMKELLVSVVVAASSYGIRKVLAMKNGRAETEVEISMLIERISAFARSDFDAALRATSGTSVHLIRENDKGIKVVLRDF